MILIDLIGRKCYLLETLICISVIMSKTEHLFICLRVIHISCFLNGLNSTNLLNYSFGGHKSFLHISFSRNCLILIIASFSTELVAFSPSARQNMLQIFYPVCCFLLTLLWFFFFMQQSFYVVEFINLSFYVV